MLALLGRLPIKTRLTLWYLLFTAALLGLLGAFLVLRLRADLRATIDREVRNSSRAIEHTYTSEGVPAFLELSALSLPHTGSEAQVLGERGRVLASFGGDTAQDPMISPAQARAAASGHEQLLDAPLGDSRQPFRVLAVPVSHNGLRRVLVIAESLQGADEAVRRVLVLLLVAGPLAIGIVGLGGLVLVRNALAPVDRMRRNAQRIGIDRLHERLVASNPKDEVGQLAGTLNEMLDRLESGVEARQRLIADASHELRAPLAAMRAELDVSLRERARTHAEREVLISVREDVDRMSRIVENLLTLARADDGRLELARERIDLEDMVGPAVAQLQVLAEDKGVRLESAADGPCVTRGDQQRLHQALLNLIENAIEFTPAGGNVVVSSWRDRAEVGFTVADTGTGIPADAQAHLFDRFYKADPSRTRRSGGAGLGLAICYEIAAAHGGRIWVRSQEGKGSEFSIALPAERRKTQRLRVAQTVPR